MSKCLVTKLKAVADVGITSPINVNSISDQSGHPYQ